MERFAVVVADATGVIRLVALADPWDRPIGAIAVFVGQQPQGDGLPELPVL